jgi:hypothetical protein
MVCCFLILGDWPTADLQRSNTPIYPWVNSGSPDNAQPTGDVNATEGATSAASARG